MMWVVNMWRAAASSVAAKNLEDFIKNHDRVLVAGDLNASRDSPAYKAMNSALGGEPDAIYQAFTPDFAATHGGSVRCTGSGCPIRVDGVWQGAFGGMWAKGPEGVTGAIDYIIGDTTSMRRVAAFSVNTLNFSQQQLGESGLYQFDSAYNGGPEGCGETFLWETWRHTLTLDHIPLCADFVWIE